MPEFKISGERQALIDQLIEKLPSFRKRLHISQTELAFRIGKSRQTVSDIERNVAPMGWDTYLAIIKVFEVNNVFSEFADFEYQSALTKQLKINH